MIADVSGELVDRFWNEQDSATDGIASFPERHHYDPSGLRRSNLVKLPYDCRRIKRSVAKKSLNS